MTSIVFRLFVNSPIGLEFLPRPRLELYGLLVVVSVERWKLVLLVVLTRGPSSSRVAHLKVPIFVAPDTCSATSPPSRAATSRRHPPKCKIRPISREIPICRCVPQQTCLARCNLRPDGSDERCGSRMDQGQQRECTVGGPVLCLDAQAVCGGSFLSADAIGRSAATVGSG